MASPPAPCRRLPFPGHPDTRTPGQAPGLSLASLCCGTPCPPALLWPASPLTLRSTALRTPHRAPGVPADHPPAASLPTRAPAAQGTRVCEPRCLLPASSPPRRLAHSTHLPLREAPMACLTCSGSRLRRAGVTSPHLLGGHPEVSCSRVMVSKTQVCTVMSAPPAARVLWHPRKGLGRTPRGVLQGPHWAA